MGLPFFFLLLSWALGAATYHRVICDDQKSIGDTGVVTRIVGTGEWPSPNS